MRTCPELCLEHDVWVFSPAPLCFFRLRKEEIVSLEEIRHSLDERKIARIKDVICWRYHTAFDEARNHHLVHGRHPV